MTQIRLGVALLLLAVGAVVAASESVSVSDPDSLVAPVEVTKAAVYLDGGTIGISLVDSVGHRFLFCINGRARWDIGENAARDSTVGRMFIGAMYPTRETAVLVPDGGHQQCATLGLLKAFLNRHYTPAEQAALRERTETPGMYAPPQLEPPLEHGVRAMTVTLAVRSLERRCEPPN